MSDPLGWLWEIGVMVFYMVAGFGILLGAVILIVDIADDQARKRDRKDDE